MFLTINIDTSSRDPSPQDSVKKVVQTSTSDPDAGMTRRPQKPAVAQASSACDKLPVFNPTTTVATLLEHTPPHHKSNPHTGQPTLPNSTPKRSTYPTNKPHTHHTPLTMDQAKEFLEMPREFVKDGRQFITRCSKRTSSLSLLSRSRRKGRKKRVGSLHSLGIASPAFKANRKEATMLLLSHHHARMHALGPQ